MGGMAEHTQLIDAINIRTAVRAYDDEPIDDDTARQLEMALQPINLLGDLNIQLVRDQPKVFAEANASGHLTNAANYLAIVGPANDEEAKERAGFYAERMVLTATLRGLGTLWVAGSWDKAEAAKHCRVTSGQELYLGVVIGHPKNHLDYQAKSYEELCEAQRTHRATKTYEQFTATMSDEGREAAPDWFKSGVEAAMKAPSAMNRRQSPSRIIRPTIPPPRISIRVRKMSITRSMTWASPSCTSRSVPAKASGLGATVACSSISNL